MNTVCQRLNHDEAIIESGRLSYDEATSEIDRLSYDEAIIEAGRLNSDEAEDEACAERIFEYIRLRHEDRAADLLQSLVLKPCDGNLWGKVMARFESCPEELSEALFDVVLRLEIDAGSSGQFDFHAEMINDL